MFKVSSKVILGMSGGVDSSVSAFLLKQQGYYVEGLFMKNWEEDDNNENCSAKNDLDDAKKVCDKLGIKLHTVNFSAEFWNKVFQNFLTEYEAGRTPNPDIICNKEIKFKLFLKFAIENLGADYIATGHYARTLNIDKKNKLLRGTDLNKDQSYFLYTLSHKQISKTIFPVGMLKKSIVRKIAKNINLVNANKKDSTGICFIGNNNFRKFISRYLLAKPGRIISVDGNDIGYHPGLIYYTIGQRRGLGIGGIKNSTKDPWYVVDKKIDKNILIVAQGRNHRYLMSNGLIAKKLYWVDRCSIKKTFRCTVKTRYRQCDIPCTVTKLNSNKIKVDFDQLVSAVTPGQSAVFYNSEICLGGGIIENAYFRENDMYI